MNGDCIHGIVDFELDQGLGDEEMERACDGRDEERHPRGETVATTSDGNHSCREDLTLSLHYSSERKAYSNRQTMKQMPCSATLTLVVQLPETRFAEALPSLAFCTEGTLNRHHQ